MTIDEMIGRWKFREALRSVSVLVPRTLLARRLWWPATPQEKRHG